MSLNGSVKPGCIITGRISDIDYILMTAYGIAVQNGFTGTETEWLESLEGKNAYEVAVAAGFKGTEQEWLDSLDGTKVPLERIIEAVAAYFVENPVEDGLPGHDGTTFYPHLDSAGDLSWTNDGGKENPQTVNIKGEKGDKGDKGEQGIPGENGTNGKDGKDGVDGTNGKDGTNGRDGKDGADGHTPVKGVDYFTETEKNEMVAEVIASITNADEVSY